MSKAHVEIAKAVRELPIDQLVSLIEESNRDADIAVMDRLVMGAVAAPILAGHIRKLTAALQEVDANTPTQEFVLGIPSGGIGHMAHIETQRALANIGDIARAALSQCSAHREAKP